jgi:large-conductance mechanosensitive channel
VSKSLIEDILMPLFRALFNNPATENAFLVLVRGKSGNTTDGSIEGAASDGAVTLNYGRFVR